MTPTRPIRLIVWHIDSLLQFNFFSLERCRRTSLFFGSVKHKQQWHCPPCRLRNTASIRRTVDWCGTWQTEHAAAFASPLRRLAAELCRELVSFDRSVADKDRDAERPALACREHDASDDYRPG